MEKINRRTSQAAKKTGKETHKMVRGRFVQDHHYDPGGSISAGIIHAVLRIVRKKGQGTKWDRPEKCTGKGAGYGSRSHGGVCGKAGKASRDSGAGNVLDTAESDKTDMEEEIPVRNVRLIVKGSRRLGPDNRQVEIDAEILPHNATYRDIIWKVTNDAGVDSNGAELSDVEIPGGSAGTAAENGCAASQKEGFRIHKVLKALGDGKHNVRCCVKNGRDKVSLISQVSFTAEGLGLAEFNPYEFIYGTLYTAAEQTPSVGQDRGIVPKGGTYIAFEKVNFGKNGSDEITIPVYELDNKPFPIEIWKGIPGEEGSELMDKVIYDKPSIWATYQEKTYKLPKRFKGLSTVSFIADHDINIKGFSFKKYERAYDENLAVDNDALYGGNNVSLTYKAMDFSHGVHGITICGRSVLEKNTIHIRFSNDEGRVNQIAEFVMIDADRSEDGYVCRHFALDNVEGLYDVNLVFLPGCNFDLKWFKFE